MSHGLDRVTMRGTRGQGGFVAGEFHVSRRALVRGGIGAAFGLGSLAALPAFNTAD